MAKKARDFEVGMAADLARLVPSKTLAMPNLILPLDILGDIHVQFDSDSVHYERMKMITWLNRDTFTSECYQKCYVSAEHSLQMILKEKIRSSGKFKRLSSMSSMRLSPAIG